MKVAQADSSATPTAAGPTMPVANLADSAGAWAASAGNASPTPTVAISSRLAPRPPAKIHVSCGGRAAADAQLQQCCRNRQGSAICVAQQRFEAPVRSPWVDPNRQSVRGSVSSARPIFWPRGFRCAQPILRAVSGNVMCAEPLRASVAISRVPDLASPRGQLLVRMTWISRSLIFLRKVLRLTPSRSAARIWFPRVAASAAESSGYSISRRMRW